MNVIVVNYVYSHKISSPRELLKTYFGLTGWVKGLIASGANVSIFQRFHEDYIEQDKYHFITDPLDPKIGSFQVPRRLHNNIHVHLGSSCLNQTETIIHVNGMVFPIQIFHLRRSVGNQVAIVIQNHAERPRRGIRGIIQKACLRYADGLIFSTKEHAREWEIAGFIQKDHHVGIIMEISSNLIYEDKKSARANTGLNGNPILLWTGNLNHNKDPLTILRGFELILQDKPDARLYMAFREDDLLQEVEHTIKASEKLAGAVYLLGHIPYSDISHFYNSADFFVQGSHYEGSGIAVLDALVCGLIPVVTDIPSFRVMTDNGRVGALWDVGDHNAFAEAFLSLQDQPIEEHSTEARQLFSNEFSFDVLGRRAFDYYQKVLQFRGEN